MPRNRMSPDEAVAAIAAAINATPAKKLTHRDLITALTAAGKAEAAEQVIALASNGQLSTIIEADPNGKPAMMVTLPSGG